MWRRIGRAFLITLLLIALVAVVLQSVIWQVDQFITSDEFRDRIIDQTASFVDAEPDVQEVKWLIDQGFDVKRWQISRPIPGENPGANAHARFYVHNLFLKYEWSFLYTGRFVVNRIELKEPRFTVVYDENGAHAPVGNKAYQSFASESDTLVINPRKFRLNDARIYGLAPHQTEADAPLQVLNMRVEGKIWQKPSRAMQATGELFAKTVRLWAWPELNDVSGQATFEERRLRIDSFRGKLLGGRLSGDVNVGFDDRQLPLKSRFEWRNAEVEKVAEALTGRQGVATGRADLRGYFLSPAADIARLSGGGILVLRAGQLLDVAFLRKVSQLLGGIEALERPDYEKIEVDFEVADGRIKIDSFSMHSALFDVRGSGQFSLGGQLDLQFGLVLEPSLAASLQPEIARRAEVDNRERLVLPLRLSGSMTTPVVVFDDTRLAEPNEASSEAGSAASDDSAAAEEASP